MMVIYLNINHLDYIIKEPKKIKTNDACMRRSPSSFSFPDYSDIPGIYFNFGDLKIMVQLFQKHPKN
jgi:hypothetical protein